MSLLLFVAVVLSVQCIGFSLGGLVDCSNFTVEWTDKIKEDHKRLLDPPHKRFVYANGILIAGPDIMPDFVYKQAARIITKVSDHFLPGYLDRLLANDAAIFLERGRGGGVTQNARMWVSAGDQGFQCNDGHVHVLMHEFGHAIDKMFTSELWEQLNAAFNNANGTDTRVWPADSYAMSHWDEYFADIYKVWFGFPSYGMNNRNDLKEKDPKLYEVVKQVFKEPEWEFKCDEVCAMEPHECCFSAFDSPAPNGFEDGEWQKLGDDKLQLCGDQPDLEEWNWNDKIGSMQVGPGCKIEAYDDTNYQGEKLNVDQGEHKSLDGPPNMDNRISSLKFVQRFQ